MSYGKVILGFLGGAAAGAILGVLYAPDSGIATRKKIAEKGRDYSDDVRNKFNSFIDDIESRIDETSGKIHETTEKFRRKSKEAVNEAKR